MSAILFVDRAGTLSNLRRTAVGGLLVDAKLARVGVLEYQDGDKVVRRYNPASVLEAALSQVSTIPVTNRHPEKFVDTSNYSKLAAGHVVGEARFSDGHIHATLAINDAALIRDIEMGVAREVSLGYSAVHDGVPGEADGHAWDEARTQLFLNHAAIVPTGRAGSTVRLQLDASGEIPQEDTPVTVTLKISGKEVAADAAQPAIDALEAQLVAAQAQVTDSAEKLAASEAKIAEVSADAFIDAKVAEKIAAKAAQDAFDAKVAKVKAKFGAKLDESKLTSREYVDALDFACSSDVAALEGTVTTDAVKVEAVAPVAAHEVLKAKRRDAWRTKPATK